VCYLVRSFWENHPPVGFWICVLAVAGVLVPYFRENVTKKEKTYWAAVMLVLLVLEIKSIYQEQAESQEKFNRTIAEFTGGDSYIYFNVTNILAPTEIPIPGIAKGSLIAPAFSVFVGEYPLRDVIVHTFCQGWLPIVEYRTYYPNEQGRPRQMIDLQFSPAPGNSADCQLFISGSNGSYSQIFHFVKQDQTWVWGSILTKYGNDKFRHEYSGPNFPEDYKFPEKSQN
jgi:hypothetical protein